MTPMHLLVLERDPARREALLGVLRSGGHHAVAAPDALAAAAAIGLPGFDALLLDLGLPDLDVPRLREVLAPAASPAPDSLEAAERRHIALVLRHTHGNKRQAAHLLGISRSTLLHKVRKYGLATGVLLALAATALLALVPTGLLGPGVAQAMSAAPIPRGARPLLEVAVDLRASRGAARSRHDTHPPEAGHHDGAAGGSAAQGERGVRQAD
jgi:CheY-like chemotaxis protein